MLNSEAFNTAVPEQSCMTCATSAARVLVRPLEIPVNQLKVCVNLFAGQHRRRVNGSHGYSTASHVCVRWPKCRRMSPRGRSIPPAARHPSAACAASVSGCGPIRCEGEPRNPACHGLASGQAAHCHYAHPSSSVPIMACAGRSRFCSRRCDPEFERGFRHGAGAGAVLTECLP